MLPDKITLIDINEPLVTYWNEVFKDDPAVEAEYGDYFDCPADAMVSPANSFGIMDGGIDLAIRKKLGHNVEKEVQKEIETHFHGELPVGAAVLVDTEHERWPYLVAATTMRVPENVKHTANAYLAFRAVLLLIRNYNTSQPHGGEDEIRSLICCGLATGCGGMSFSRCAVQMKAAWDQVNGSPELGRFDEIYAKHRLLMTL